MCLKSRMLREAKRSAPLSPPARVRQNGNQRWKSNRAITMPGVSGRFKAIGKALSAELSLSSKRRQREAGHERLSSLDDCAGPGRRSGRPWVDYSKLRRRPKWILRLERLGHLRRHGGGLSH